MNNIGPLPPPDSVYVSNIIQDSRSLTFSWSPVNSSCSALRYNIHAHNCGTCPIVTVYTTVTCNGVITDGRSCTFAVSTSMCGDSSTGLDISSASVAISLMGIVNFPSNRSDLKKIVMLLCFFIIYSSKCTSTVYHTPLFS